MRNLMQKNTSMNDNQHKDSKKSSCEGYREIINPIKPHAKTQSNTKKNSFIESYFFYPKLWHKILAYALLPFSCIYISIALCKKYLTKKMRFDIKILSIGNLVSGGSGKTPFCIALTQHLHKQGYTNIYIVFINCIHYRCGYKMPFFRRTCACLSSWTSFNLCSISLSERVC